MVRNTISTDDRDFLAAFERGAVPPAQFDHRVHLRLADMRVVEHDPVSAERRIRRALLAFLQANDVPADQFHVTITHAWSMAVRHFMNRAPSRSFAEFAANSRPLLDSKALLTRYSAGVLFSDVARARFVEPDREPIPA